MLAKLVEEVRISAGWSPIDAIKLPLQGVTSELTASSLASFTYSDRRSRHYPYQGRHSFAPASLADVFSPSISPLDSSHFPRSARYASTCFSSLPTRRTYIATAHHVPASAVCTSTSGLGIRCVRRSERLRPTKELGRARDGLGQRSEVERAVEYTARRNGRRSVGADSWTIGTSSRFDGIFANSTVRTTAIHFTSTLCAGSAIERWSFAS